MHYTKITCHRDGTITFWDVYCQRWRKGIPLDAELATMTPANRRRAIRHVRSSFQTPLRGTR